ncbi:MAG: glycoside hydrolase [Pedobacter sp.]|jgi:uncharacterized protein YyaL (SSP411 family)|nr:glycoside hydrolase [Pedobacter sp.]
MKRIHQSYLLFSAVILFSIDTANAQKKNTLQTPDTSKAVWKDGVNADYRNAVKVLYKGIQQNFYEPKTNLYLETTGVQRENKHSWLWPLCALIQATNEMEQLEPAKDYMSGVARTIDQYYNDAPPAPAYQDYVTAERKSSRFFDDNQWIAIAYLDAYNRNKKPMYLQKAKMIYEHMVKAGLDTVSGGGLYWKEGEKDSKNTCSNGPGILVSLQLYKVTHDQKYLDMALGIYNWANKYLQSPEGIYYDAIKVPSLQISRPFYTYNTGSMLQSNVLLYEVTKDKKYLKEAQRIALAGKLYFYHNGRLPSNYWFNAVMLRGYEALYKVDKDIKWIEFFKEDANRIWAGERDKNNLVGTKTEKSLLDQAGMLEIYARLAAL